MFEVIPAVVMQVTEADKVDRVAVTKVAAAPGDIMEEAVILLRVGITLQFAALMADPIIVLLTVLAQAEEQAF
jgi:hypothetical protein